MNSEVTFLTKLGRQQSRELRDFVTKQQGNAMSKSGFA